MKPNLPPLEITENCSFCEQTQREVESLSRRMQKAMNGINRRMDILEIATLILAKDKENGKSNET